MRCLVWFPVVVVLAGGCLAVPRSRFQYDRITKAVADGRPGAQAPEEAAGLTAAETLTLERAVELALSGNPDIRIALERVRQAEARRREVSAVFLPVVSADVGFLRADAPSRFLFKAIDSGTLAPGTDFNDPGTFSNWETGLKARYNLYQGGRDVLDRWMAQTGEDISRLDYHAVENALVAGVILGYYDVLMAGEIVETARSSVETVEAQLRETETRWREGNALRSDVLSLRVRLAEAEERVIRADNGRKLALAALANLLGADADTELRLSAQGGDLASLPGDYAEALGEALLRRPELERARKMVERASLGLSAAKRSFLPSVDAEARTYWDDPDFEYRGDRTNWFVGVALTWKLFEGGRRFATVERSRAVLQEMLSADRKETLAVQLDVKNAYLRLREAEARVKVTEAGVEQAEETLSLVRSQYEGGTATITRYLEAELALTRARMRRTNAAFDLRKAVAEAARGIGRFSRRRGSE